MTPELEKSIASLADVVKEKGLAVIDQVPELAEQLVRREMLSSGTGALGGLVLLGLSLWLWRKFVILSKDDDVEDRIFAHVCGAGCAFLSSLLFVCQTYGLLVCFVAPKAVAFEALLSLVGHR